MYKILLLTIISFTTAKAQKINLSNFMGSNKVSYIIKKNNDTLFAENINAMKSNKLNYTLPDKSTLKSIKKFKHAKNGGFKFVNYEIKGENQKVFQIHAESDNKIMLTCLWRGKYYNHIYYYLVDKKSKKLILKSSYKDSQRTKKLKLEREKFYSIVNNHIHNK